MDYIEKFYDYVFPLDKDKEGLNKLALRLKDPDRADRNYAEHTDGRLLIKVYNWDDSEEAIPIFKKLTQKLFRRYGIPFEWDYALFSDKKFAGPVLSEEDYNKLMIIITKFNPMTEKSQLTR